jgi:hypothetical protein
MNHQSWTQIYLTLVAAALVVCGMFHGTLGLLHLGSIVAVAVIMPLIFAALGGRVEHPLESPQRRSRPRVLLIAAIFAIGCAKFAALGFVSSGFVPAVHDEWSYIFGAKTFALGRVRNPTPADAEFFDAFHILTQPHWVTRYPPGHPAALAIGVLCGAPWLVPVVLSAGTVVWTYFLARVEGGELAGWFAAILAVLSPGLDYLSSGYLSQSTFLFAITGCFVCVLNAVIRRSPALAISAGVLGGWAILTRPYSAAAFGAPIAVWFVFRLMHRHIPEPPIAGARELPAAPAGASAVRCLIAGVAPVVVAVGLFGAYNVATTGNALQTAWDEYNDQFEPDNRLGIGGDRPQRVPDGLHARKRHKAEQIARERRAFTWRAATRLAIADPTRMSQMVFPALGFYGLLVFLPFAFRDGRHDVVGRGTCNVVVAAMLVHYVAYSAFYARWGAYGQEAVPLVIALVATGLASFWQRSQRSHRPMLALVAPLALLVAIALAAFVQIPRFIDQRSEDTAEHRKFAAAVRVAAEQDPLLVFVQFDAAGPAEYDLINNSPSLDDRVIVALDLGAHNARLVGRFPERRAFMYEQATGALRPWAPPPANAPARLSDRLAPQFATAN